MDMDEAGALPSFSAWVMGRINLEVVRHLVEETEIDQSGFSGPDGDHQN